MNKTFERLLDDTSGQDLIEYAIMAAFVAVAAIAVMPALASAVSQLSSFWGITPQEGLTRVACAALAAIFLGVIVFRRKKDADM